MRMTNYLENQTILRALEFTLAQRGFGNHATLKKTATALVRRMKSTDSVSGRHQLLMALLKKGASLQQMMKATGSSRRTIFRYLNHFEDGGAELVLVDGKYQLRS